MREYTLVHPFSTTASVNAGSMAYSGMDPIATCAQRMLQ